jgi:hypothetical protein
MDLFIAIKILIFKSGAQVLNAREMQSNKIQLTVAFKMQGISITA